MLGKGHYSKAFLPMFFSYDNSVLMARVEEILKQSHTII